MYTAVIQRGQFGKRQLSEWKALFIIIEKKLMEDNKGFEIPLTFEPSDRLQLTQTMFRRGSGVNKQDTDENVQKICRICLENQGNGPLITACKCKGSVGFVHQGCIKSWIIKKMEVSLENIVCQLCQQQFRYKLTFQRQVTCREFLNKMEAEPFKLFLIILIYLVCLGGDIYFACLLTQANSEPPDGELRNKLFPTQKMPLICTIIVIFVFVVLFLLGISFLLTFFLKKSVDVQFFSDIVHRLQEEEMISRPRRNYTKIFPIK